MASCLVCSVELKARVNSKTFVFLYLTVAHRCTSVPPGMPVVRLDCEVCAHGLYIRSGPGLCRVSGVRTPGSVHRAGQIYPVRRGRLWFAGVVVRVKGWTRLIRSHCHVEVVRVMG